MAKAEVLGVRGRKSAGPGCVAGGAWIKAPAHGAPRRPAQWATEPRRASLGSFCQVFFAGLAQGLDAGEGAPNDVLGAWIFAGQSAAGMGQALEVVGGRLGGEFDVDGFALDGPEAVETPGGGADFLTPVRLEVE